MKVCKGNRLFIVIFLVPSLLLYLVFNLYPNLSAAYYSFFRWNIADMGKSPFIGLQNFFRIFGPDRELIWTCVKNNLYFSFFGITIALIVALLITGLVTANRMKPLKEVNFYRGVVYFPNLISISATAMMWTFLYSPIYGVTTPLFNFLGLKDLAAIPLLGDSLTVKPALLVYMLWGGIGFDFVILLAAILNVPTYLYEAADIDGAGKIRRFFNITLPLISGTIRMLLIVGLATSFSGGFIVIQIMTDGGPNYASEILTSFMYRKSFGSGDFGYGAAIGTMILFLTVVLYFIVNKLFSRGENYEY